jgi:dihydroorotase
MAEAYDVLLTNGAVYDATQGLRGARKDVAIRDGRVALVADRIDAAGAREVHDVEGRCVSPGWIDIHVHGYGGLALRDIQAVGVLTGVTACVDAGDFGTLTVDDFMAVRQDSAADMYGFVHMHPAGIPYTGFARGDYGTIPVGRLIQLIEKSRDVIRGLKLSAFGDMPLHNLKVAKVIAEAARVPFYMHLGEVNHYPTKKSITRQTVDLLTEGDIITHLYTNDHGRILDEQGDVFPEVREARARGVVFDIGHGIGNFSFEIAERALAQGIGPDVLSSDQNTLCHTSPSDLATTLSKFLVLGLSLEDVIDKVTRAPRAALGLHAHGTLAADAVADVTVFRVESGDFEFSDMDGKTRRGSHRVVPETVYKAGRRYTCDADGVFGDHNFKMATQDPGRIAVDRFDPVERRFVTTLLEELERAGVAKADAIHARTHQAMAAAGMPTAPGLRTLYREVFA